jgi:hypothetical protein
MDSAIDFYERLSGQGCTMRVKYPEKELELASIGSFLLISGSAENLQPFKNTQVTLLVDSMDDFLEFSVNHGSTILEYPKSVPTGRNMRVRHPDGLIAEYVEHKRQPIP